MTRQTWIIASLLSLLIVGGIIVFSFRQKSAQIDRMQTELNQAQQAADEASHKITAIQSALEEKDARIQELEQESQKATQAQKDLEQEMRQALQSKDITISELKGKLTVDILDRILFDSGEAVLKPEGMKILTQVAEVLAQFPNRQIHVIGHTDNVPIRASAMNRYPSNWELSTARATAAVRYLCEHAAVDPRRLGAVGYGEFHPIADNATAEGRAKNRRIAIVVLSEELVGSDAAKPVSSTGDSTPAQSPPAGSDSPASPEAQPQGTPPASTHDTNTPTATNRVSMPEGSL